MPPLRHDAVEAAGQLLDHGVPVAEGSGEVLLRHGRGVQIAHLDKVEIMVTSNRAAVS